MALQTNLSVTTQELSMALDDQSQVDVIYTNFSEAFRLY